jgi:hypothetical protein
LYVNRLFAVLASADTAGTCFGKGLTVGTELAGKLHVDVPFLLQQAHFLYEKQLEELHVQMQRVNSSTSVLGQSKGIVYRR